MMAARANAMCFCLAKRVSLNISTTSPKNFLNYIGRSAGTRISRNPSFSTAYGYGHPQSQGSNAAAESSNTRITATTSDLNYERDGGVTDFVTETLKDGAKKTLDMAENVGDAAKQTVDTTYQITKETTEDMKETVIGKGDNDNNGNYGGHDVNSNVSEDLSVNELKRSEDPVDTQEYRGIEDVRAEGGYDRKL